MNYALTKPAQDRLVFSGEDVGAVYEDASVPKPSTKS
jgi:hypothetical protein